MPGADERPVTSSCPRLWCSPSLDLPSPSPVASQASASSASDLSTRDGSSQPPGFVPGFVRHVKFPCPSAALVQCHAWISGRWSVKRAFAPLNSIHGPSALSANKWKREGMETGRRRAEWSAEPPPRKETIPFHAVQSKHGLAFPPFPPCAHLHISSLPLLPLLLHSAS